MVGSFYLLAGWNSGTSRSLLPDTVRRVQGTEKIDGELEYRESGTQSSNQPEPQL